MLEASIAACLRQIRITLFALLPPMFTRLRCRRQLRDDYDAARR